MANLYDRVGVQRVINASGRMTALGGSALHPEVAAAMAQVSQDYVAVADLHLAVERDIARLIGAEAAMVTTGAAAGIAIMVAACVAGADLTRLQRLPDPGDAPHEIVIQAGHQVDFGAPIVQMIALGGGRPRPVGTVNSVHPDHLSGALDEATAAFLYVQSHHAVQKGTLSLAQCVEICHAHQVPVLVDAAAEEDLRRYTGGGADLVTFSGGKAIGGPTSGIIAGRADLIAACKAQQRGIARPMKVGKEAVAGLAEAVLRYVERDTEAERIRQRELVEELMAGFSGLPGAEPVRLADEAGRGIERAGLQLTPEDAAALVAFLAEGEPAIYPRPHLLNLGVVAFDPRPLAPGDAAAIIARVQSFFAGRAER